jgi:hypothetical protein
VFVPNHLFASIRAFSKDAYGPFYQDAESGWLLAFEDKQFIPPQSPHGGVLRQFKQFKVTEVPEDGRLAESANAVEKDGPHGT